MRCKLPKASQDNNDPQSKKECMQEMKDHRKKMCSSMGGKCPMMGNMERSPMNENAKGDHKDHH